MRDAIRFLVNGREHSVRGRAVYATLANWLRYDEGATGTKIVCEEGDCGACTVLVRRSRDEQFVPVNSCILNLAQLDGMSIVTVEGLGMNAVQQSMMTHHGAQCGYCTPGFVVAMSALYETNSRVDEKQVREGLTGNLCRCTGYEPIIKAALAVDGGAMPKLRDLYPDVPDCRDSVLVENFFAPATLEEAIAFKRDHPGCTIVQGGTDVGVWVNKRGFGAPAMLSLAKIRELYELREEDGNVLAGANVSLAAFEAFARERIPQLSQILSIFGSPQIKNAGTLAGNIANGSPIGDTLPYLFITDAVLELNGGARSVPVSRFYLGYKKFDLRPDEIITRVRVPRPGAAAALEAAGSDGARKPSAALRLYKVSRRKDLDISAFTAAILVRTMNAHIAEAKIAYGGVGPVVMRLPKTESFLSGKPLALETFEEAGRIARSEVSPISDVRGSRDYRLQLSENILPKFFHEVTA
jgi:xanthine dehydrogenase small subunit